MECEDKVSPGPTWDLCRQLQSPSRALEGDILTGAEEEAQALLLADLGQAGPLHSKALEQLHHAAQALSAEQRGRERHTAQIRSGYRSQGLGSPEEEGVEEQDGGEVEEQDGEEQEDVGVGAEQARAASSPSKRFGGFLKGKHEYRKLMDQARPLHKRYGGFIGIRKSARKWNNQKRFSQFLKQYLGIGSHGNKLSSLSADFNRRNEV